LIKYNIEKYFFIKEDEMLVLKRIQYFNDFIRDTVDGRVIGYGEYYYEDSDDGTIISAEHYWELKKAQMEREWDDSWYNAMESERDYKEKLRQAEMKMRQSTVLNKKRLEDLRNSGGQESVHFNSIFKNR
jgi:hypothetical protein